MEGRGDSLANEKQGIPPSVSSHANEGLIHGLLAVKLYSWYLIAKEDLSRMAGGIYRKYYSESEKFQIFSFAFSFFILFESDSFRSASCFCRQSNKNI